MKTIIQNTLFTLLLIFSISYSSTAQLDSCQNRLGAWLWFIDITGFDTHGEIADTLSSLGVKRIYVKVADGTINPTIWPELNDAQLVQDYQARGLEVWAWSYNYPTSDDSLQAEALYQAAESGYEGFILDVESEFDGDSTNLADLFQAFNDARQRATNDGVITEGFPIGCTTWGNPIDHNFRIDVIDPYVDAFFPQTYVENWGGSFIDQLAYWIDVGNQEYADLGATKPIHHIVSTEQGIITSEEINEFIQVSGPQTSIWRIPGGGVPQSIWNTWRDVDWNFDFCNITSTNDDFEKLNVRLFPNPTSDFLYFKNENIPLLSFEIINAQGKVMHQGILSNSNQIDVSQLPKGIYFFKGNHENQVYHSKFLKNN